MTFPKEHSLSSSEQKNMGAYTLKAEAKFVEKKAS